MRFGLQKAGRWVAGRVKGSKGVQGYDQFMKDNPWASKALTVGDIAAATVGGAALLGGGNIGAGFSKAGSALKSAGGGVKGLLSPSSVAKTAITKEGVTAPMTFGQAIKQPQVLAGGVQGLLGMLPDAKSAAMEEQTKLGQGQLDLQKAQFEEEKRRAQMEEERKRRIAEMLMPFMQKNFPQYVSGGR